MINVKMFDLSGKVAVVTGGNGGIGRGIALGLATAGAKVAILARNEQRNRDTLAELRALGNPALALKLDVARRADLKPALASIERELGPIDILVNNAAFAVLKSLLEHTEEDWDSVIETDLTACFLLSKYAAQSMVQRRAGKIINVASVGGYNRHPHLPIIRSQQGRPAPANPMPRDRTGALPYPGELPGPRLDHH